jgi:hypothetical protein
MEIELTDTELVRQIGSDSASDCTPPVGSAWITAYPEAKQLAV